MKNYMLLTILFFGLNLGHAQTSLNGKVIDGETNEPILFGSVVLYKNGSLITGTETDLDGFYNLANIDPGTYDVEASYVGYNTQRVTNVIVYGGQANNLDIKLGGGVDLQEVVVVQYKIPLIKQDCTTSGGTLTSEQLKKLPTRNINSMASHTAGIRSGKSKKKWKRKKKKSARSEATFYLVDGIRVQGKAQKKSRLKKWKESRAAKKQVKKENQAIRNSEEYGKFVENDFIAAQEENTSTFSIDVDKASYSLARRYLTQNRQMPPQDAVRIEEMINYFDYEYDSPEGKEPFAVYTETARCPWNAENILLKVGIQGKKMEKNTGAANNLVFLIDVSGSMGSAKKLQLIKPAFKYLIRNLRAQDRVAIVTYAGAAGLVLPSTSAADSTTIYKALDNLQSGGSTAGGAGIQLAYKTALKNFIKEGNNRVILATDGDFNVGISDPTGLENLIVKKRKEGVYLTTLGFGMGNYKDNRMEILADKGNGNYSYIDDMKEAKKVFVTDLTGTLYTIAKDVKIQIDFDKEFVKNYRLIGYENRLLEKEDFHDDTKDAGELGAGHTVTALYEIKLKSEAPEEFLKLKLRYKFPKNRQSNYIETFAMGDAQPFELASENFQFAASVAGFGMLLRGSKYTNNLTYEQVAQMATAAKGKDEFGYRKELIELVEIAQGMNAQVK